MSQTEQIKRDVLVKGYIWLWTKQYPQHCGVLWRNTVCFFTVLKRCRFHCHFPSNSSIELHKGQVCDVKDISCMISEICHCMISKIFHCSVSKIYISLQRFWDISLHDVKDISLHDFKDISLHDVKDFKDISLHDVKDFKDISLVETNPKLQLYSRREDYAYSHLSAVLAITLTPLFYSF